MNVQLADFGYSFVVKGAEGGLRSLHASFVPARSGPEDTAAAKAAMQGVVDRYINILDVLFAKDFLDGRRQPRMSDRPDSVDVGYEYKGTWKKRLPLVPARDVSTRLAEMFGIRDPDMRGAHNPHWPHTSSITFSARKRGEALHDPRVVVNCCFDHKLNACLFRFTQAIDDVEISDTAAGQMAMLDRTLALDWDRTGRDHYAALTQAGPANSSGAEGAP